MADTVATHERGFAGTRDWAGFDTSGSLPEAVGGGVAVVLSILGLLDVAPGALGAIATIAVGASLLMMGSALATRFSRYLPKREPHVAAEVVGEEVAMESLCGAAGIILGILALVGAGEAMLLPAAVIVFGGGLLMASETTWRLNRTAAAYVEEGSKHDLHDVFESTVGPEVLIALGGIVLGILGLAGAHAILLSLIAMLGYGFAVLLSGTSLASRMLTVFTV